MAESSLNVLETNIAAGIYVVKVVSQGSTVSSKVFVK